MTGPSSLRTLSNRPVEPRSPSNLDDLRTQAGLTHALLDELERAEGAVGAQRLCEQASDELERLGHLLLAAAGSLRKEAERAGIGADVAP